ncbi:MAG: metallophosphoesterase [Firmicutes bacterium]|nr:metallophosphoesterase [Bacillota bacterium]
MFNRETRERTKKKWLVFIAIILCNFLLAVFPMLFTATAQDHFEEDASGTIRIGVLADPHYFPLEYIDYINSFAYLEYISRDPKMLAESGAAFRRALEMAFEVGVDYILVPGDIALEGEYTGNYNITQYIADFYRWTRDTLRERYSDDTLGGVPVFVTPGNHCYNNELAFSFADGIVRPVRYTTQADFARKYFTDFMTCTLENPSRFPDITFMDGANFFYTPTRLQEIYDLHPRYQPAGGLSYSIPLRNGFSLLSLDVTMNTPYFWDKCESRYYGYITGGTASQPMLDWAVEEIARIHAEGRTIIGMMHHPIIPHIRHQYRYFQSFILYNWEHAFETLADAGLRYIFVGHMHANSISRHWTYIGNPLLSFQSAAAISYPGGFRTVSFTTGYSVPAFGNRERAVRMESTTHQIYNVHFRGRMGNGQYVDEMIYDWYQRIFDTLYVNLGQRMARGIVLDMIEEIMDADGLRGFVEGLDFDFFDLDNIDDFVLDMVAEALVAPMTMDMGGLIGRITISFNTATQNIRLAPSGTADLLLNPMYITRTQILGLVQNLITQFENRYLIQQVGGQPRLAFMLGEIVDRLVNFPIYRPGTPQERTLEEIVLLAFHTHLRGNAQTEINHPWAMTVIDQFNRGQIIDDLAVYAIGMVRELLQDVLNNLTVNINDYFSGFWLTGVGTVTGTGNQSIESLLSGFGFSVLDMVDDFVATYLTTSYTNSLGQTVAKVLEAFLVDVNEFRDGNLGETVVIIDILSETRPQDPSIGNGRIPSQINLTFGADVFSYNLSWTTGPHVETGVVQFSIGGTGFDENNYTQIWANSRLYTYYMPNIDLGFFATFRTIQRHRHTVSMNGLQAGTTIFYRVGCAVGNYFSEVFVLRTTPSPEERETDYFSFLVTSDAQGMMRSDFQVFANTLNTAISLNPNALFQLKLGDFVELGQNNAQWTYLFDEARGAWAQLPLIPVSGNHEVAPSGLNAFRRNFNFDGFNGGFTEDGAYFYLVYDNMRLIVLDSNDYSRETNFRMGFEQVDWLTRVLDEATEQFIIVAMHYSLVSGGHRQNNREILAMQEQLLPILNAGGVSLVLGAHDHLHFRSHSLIGTQVESVSTEAVKFQGMKYEAISNPQGITFVTSSTGGVKFYSMPSIENQSDLAVITAQPYLPVFNRIVIRGNTLFFDAYTVCPVTNRVDLLDSFAIVRGASGGAEEDPIAAASAVAGQINALPRFLSQAAVWGSGVANRYNINHPDFIAADNAIQNARASFNALSTELREYVYNLDVLTHLERYAQMLMTVHGGLVHTVNTRAQLTSAVGNVDVRVIVISGSFNASGTAILPTARHDVHRLNRDIVIRGTQASNHIRYATFYIENGATAMIDNIHINGTRTMGSIHGGLQSLNVMANSTLIVNGAGTRVTAEFGASGQAIGIRVQQANARLVVNNSAEISGSVAGIRVENATASATIFGGNVQGKEGSDRAAIRMQNGRLNMHGGELGGMGNIVSGTAPWAMWASGSSVINWHGGSVPNNEFGRTPVRLDGANVQMNVTGGTFGRGTGTFHAIEVQNSAQLHLNPTSMGAVRIQANNGAAPVWTDPFISNVNVMTSPHIHADFSGLSSNAAHFAGSGFFTVPRRPLSFEDQTTLTTTAVTSTTDVANGRLNSTSVPAGSHYVMARINVGNRTGSQSNHIPGIWLAQANAQAFLYSNVSIAHHHAVTDVEIWGEREVVMQAGAERNLIALTGPDNAMLDMIDWRVQNRVGTNVVSITPTHDTRATMRGEGVGVATIHSDVRHYAGVTDSISVFVVDPVINLGLAGAVVRQGTPRSLSWGGAPTGAYGGLFSAIWRSQQEHILTVNQSGVVTPTGLGEAIIIIDLYFRGNPTGISASTVLTVVCDETSYSSLMFSHLGVQFAPVWQADYNRYFISVPYEATAIYGRLEGVTYIRFGNDEAVRFVWQNSIATPTRGYNHITFTITSESSEGVPIVINVAIYRRRDIATKISAINQMIADLAKIDCYVELGQVIEEIEERISEWDCYPLAGLYNRAGIESELVRKDLLIRTAAMEAEVTRINGLIANLNAHTTITPLYNAIEAIQTSIATWNEEANNVTLTGLNMAGATANYLSYHQTRLETMLDVLRLSNARAAAVERFKNEFNNRFYLSDYRLAEREVLEDLRDAQITFINLMNYADAIAFDATTFDWSVFDAVLTDAQMVANERHAAMLLERGVINTLINGLSAFETIGKLETHIGSIEQRIVTWNNGLNNDMLTGLNLVGSTNVYLSYHQARLDALLEEQALQNARAAAVERFISHFNSNFVEADYLEEQWLVLVGLKNDEIVRIESLNFVEATAYVATTGTVWAPFKAVLTRSRIENEVLYAARDEALRIFYAEFDRLFDENDYREIEWTELWNIRLNERNRIMEMNIDEANTFDENSTNWTPFNDILTDAQMTANELASARSAAVERFKNEFNSRFYLNDYRLAERGVLEGLRDAQIAQINQMNYADAIAFDASIFDWTEFNAVLTDAQMTVNERNEAMIAEKNRINDLIAELEHIPDLADLEKAIDAIDGYISTWNSSNHNDTLSGINTEELEIQRIRLDIVEPNYPCECCKEYDCGCDGNCYESMPAYPCECCQEYDCDCDGNCNQVEPTYPCECCDKFDCDCDGNCDDNRNGGGNNNGELTVEAEVVNGGAIRIVVEGDVGAFLGLYVNGVRVPSEFITIKTNSFIIIVSEEFVETLSAGENEFIASFATGEARIIVPIIHQTTSSDGLSGGAIAGIVIGVVLVLAIGGFAIFWLINKKKKSTT